jgi:GH25 family lysozyme M1 (1,4-beta-N-acetylmuramidase)
VDENETQLAPEMLALALVEFIEPLIEAGFDIPIIRTGNMYWTDDDSLEGCTGFCMLPLYIAHWTTNAAATIPDAWSDWTFWEYSSTGSIGGITGNTYLIRFNGDEEDLDAMRAP